MRGGLRLPERRDRRTQSNGRRERHLGGSLGKLHREEKRATHSGGAFQSNSSAHEFSQARRNRQPQAGTAVAPRGRSVGLPEGLKNQALHFDRNADTGVGY